MFSLKLDDENIEAIANMFYVYIFGLPDHVIEHKYKKLLTIRRDVSWLHKESRIVENILSDAKNECYV